MLATVDEHRAQLEALAGLPGPWVCAPRWDGAEARLELAPGDAPVELVIVCWDLDWRIGVVCGEIALELVSGRQSEIDAAGLRAQLVLELSQLAGRIVSGFRK